MLKAFRNSIFATSAISAALLVSPAPVASATWSGIPAGAGGSDKPNWNARQPLHQIKVGAREHQPWAMRIRLTFCRR